jgi:hypothetical protein
MSQYCPLNAVAKAIRAQKQAIKKKERLTAEFGGVL